MRRLLSFFVVLACIARPAQAAQDAVADVVVIVDTSTSMTEPGMDPDRASLLVAKLLADIVPGELAVLRLLDLAGDRASLPSQGSGKFGPCAEDPRNTCEAVEPAVDWTQKVRAEKPGSAIRPSRGDAAYKKGLETHLQQNIHNSLFHLAFHTALGIFDGHPAAAPRTVVWLSDGRSDDPTGLRQAVDAVKGQAHAAVEAIVFGAGDTRPPQQAGVDEVTKVGSPADMMKAFANVFRRIVQAPYRIDNEIAAAPSFSMKPSIKEAWVVVYGDKTLGPVELTGPSTRQAADYAADAWAQAGAYKVAYLRQPAAGDWTVSAQGGGKHVAYAVIQRSDLTPALLGPAQALAGTRLALVAGITAGDRGEPLTDPTLLKDATLTAEFDGQSVALKDDGQNGDQTAGDGRYSGFASFPAAGQIPIKLHLQSPIADRTVEATLKVEGGFNYVGGPVAVDLGTLGVSAESCRPLLFQASQQGQIAFELRSLQSLPSGHSLTLRLPAGSLEPGGTLTATPGAPWQVCLKTAARVSSSEAYGEPWLLLAVAGSQEPNQQVTIKLSWNVIGLSFWALWGWLILSLLGLLLALFIIMGFIWPQRFRGALAVVFVPDREDLDEQSPQPVKQWQGVGIGFYRHARAYLHPDYRLSGKARGALAGLFAERGGNRVAPCNGTSLFRETLDGDWEAVPPQGCRCRPGDVYRIGMQGPYFRIAARG